MTTNFNYPTARKDEDNLETVHDTILPDPYAWLLESDSQDCKQYIELENQLTNSILGVEELREKIALKYQIISKFNEWTCPVRRDNKLFFEIQFAYTEKNIVCSIDADVTKGKNKMQVVFDDTTVKQSTSMTVCKKSISHNGRYLAYGVKEVDEKCMAIHVLNIESNDSLDIVIEGAYIDDGIHWTQNNKGFFYGRLEVVNIAEVEKSNKEEPVVIHNLFYHQLGNEPKDDVLLCDFEQDPSSLYIDVESSQCGELVFISITNAVENILFYFKTKEDSLFAENKQLSAIVHDFDGGSYNYITNEGSIVYLVTNYNSPKSRIMTVDLNDSDKSKWITLVHEHDTDAIDMVQCAANNKLVTVYVRGVRNVIVLHSLCSGEVLFELDLGIGSLESISTLKSSSEIFYSISTFLSPDTIYRFDCDSTEDPPSIFHEANIQLPNYDPHDYKIEYIFFESKDKAKIPMLIVRRKCEIIKPRPCLMIGYGGYGVCVKPAFNVSVLLFLHTFDGMYAMPALRGGGEFGAKWHDDGRLLKKQNTFNDFQAAAEYLIKNNYTTPDRLAIQGEDHGGLVVGACINQRPELFGTAIISTGILDVIRLPFYTNSAHSQTEYGSLVEKQFFDAILKYSPLENIRTPKSTDEAYPATLLLSRANKNFTSELHTLKFAATLQEAVRKCEFQKQPILMRIYSVDEYENDMELILEEKVDIFVFLCKYLNVDTVNLEVESTT